MSKKLIFLPFLWMSMVSVFATELPLVDQYDDLSNDFRTRFEVAAEWKPVKNLSLSLAEEVRLKNMSSNLDRLYTTLDVSYKVYKYIKLGVSYSFHAMYKGADAAEQWQFRHRGRLHITGSYAVNNWGMSLRVMPEVTYLDAPINPLEEVNPEWLMRTRFKVDYSFLDKPVDPYLSVEMFNPLKKVEDNTAWINRLRYTVGVEWSVDAQNKFDFYYLLEHNMGQEISHTDAAVVRTHQNGLNHNLGIKYKFVF